MKQPPFQRDGAAPIPAGEMAPALRERMLAHLRIHADRLVVEWETLAKCGWNARLAMQTLSGGGGSVRTPSPTNSSPEKPEALVASLVEGFHADLMAVLEGATAVEIVARKRRFPHWTSGGSHLTLPWYLEVLSAGEEVFADEFLLGRTGFSGADAVLCFEEIDRAFHTLTEALGGAFCHDCAVPLHQKERAVADLEKGFLQRSSRE